MEERNYTVRAYFSGAQVSPSIKMKLASEDMAIALAEVLLDEKNYNYVTIWDEIAESELLCLSKEIDLAS